MMIKLSGGCYVAADQITEVKVNVHGKNITVRTKDGIGHCHLPPYTHKLYSELDRLIAEINSAPGETA
jgi:hypothetical protein